MQKKYLTARIYASMIKSEGGEKEMVNIKTLEEEMKMQNVTDTQMANMIGVDLSTWYRRKAAPNKLQIGEIEIIKNALCLSNEKALSIFLN